MKRLLIFVAMVGLPAAAAACLKAGINHFLDRHKDAVTEALKRGLVTEADLDAAVLALAGLGGVLGDRAILATPHAADALRRIAGVDRHAIHLEPSVAQAHVIARQPDDERGPEGEPRHSRAELADQALEEGGGDAARPPGAAGPVAIRGPS